MDAAYRLQEQVRHAAVDRQPLRIRGGGTRGHLCANLAAEARTLEVGEHCGLVAFEPNELVLTARGGTRLDDIEATLAEAGQMLPFDPPRFGTGSTLGGAIASGLAGPGRPWYGAARDAVLGVKLLDGRGEIGRFGGEVMKNVAGYDVSRLNAGAFGALGVLLDVSLRVLPVPQQVETRVLEMDLPAARMRMLELARAPLPLTGLAWEAGRLWVRLAGSAAGIDAVRARLGGERAIDDFWTGLRDQNLPFFHESANLWRLSLPVTAPEPDLAGVWLLDWGGAQRWCRTDVGPSEVLAAAAACGGHAMRVRPDCVRTPLAPGIRVLHERIKRVFDPAGILNPGVLYPDLV